MFDDLLNHQTKKKTGQWDGVSYSLARSRP